MIVVECLLHVRFESGLSEGTGTYISAQLCSWCMFAHGKLSTGTCSGRADTPVQPIHSLDTYVYKQACIPLYMYSLGYLCTRVATYSIFPTHTHSHTHNTCPDPYNRAAHMPAYISGKKLSFFVGVVDPQVLDFQSMEEGCE